MLLSPDCLFCVWLSAPITSAFIQKLAYKISTNKAESRTGGPIFYISVPVTGSGTMQSSLLRPPRAKNSLQPILFLDRGGEELGNTGFKAFKNWIIRGQNPARAPKLRLGEFYTEVLNIHLSIPFYLSNSPFQCSLKS